MNIKSKLRVFFQILPIFLSMLLISAHFYRAGYNYLSYFLLIIPFILIIKNKISVRIIQVILFLSTIEWWRVTYNIYNIRIHYKMPWIRFTIIMGIVAVFTLSSVFIFYTKTMKSIYLNDK